VIRTGAQKPDVSYIGWFNFDPLSCGETLQAATSTSRERLAQWDHNGQHDFVTVRTPDSSGQPLIIFRPASLTAKAFAGRLVALASQAHFM